MSQSFQVVSQTAQLIKNSQGQYVQGYRVTAQLPSGTTFYVDVPGAAYDPETVKGMLRDQAAKLGELEGYAE